MTDMHTYLVEEELEHYAFGFINRREFIRRLALLGVGAASAAALAATVQPQPAQAAPALQTSPNHVPESDPSVSSERITYTSADGVQISGYLVWETGTAMERSRPGVVVVHANQGLLPHFEDVARRFAKRGYVALAPDLVTRVGPPRPELTEDEGRSAFASLPDEAMGADLVAAVNVLAGHEAVDETKLATTGFCAGGSNVWRLVTLSPRLRAAAPFYGSAPAAATVPNIRAAVLGVCASEDERITNSNLALEPELQRAGITYRIKIYPNSVHGFHADDNPRNYNPITAVEAWQDTLAWFAEHLGLAS